MCNARGILKILDEAGQWRDHLKFSANLVLVKVVNKCDGLAQVSKRRGLCFAFDPVSELSHGGIGVARKNKNSNSSLLKLATVFEKHFDATNEKRNNLEEIIL